MSIFYTLEEVAKHNEAKDLWVIIHNSIYDLTKFLKEHPGGEEVLLNLAGGDGSECFDTVGHSMEAKQRRELFKVGNLTEADSKKLKGGSIAEGLPSTQSNVKDEEPWDYVEHKEESSPWIPLFLGLGILVYAIIFTYIF